MTIFLFTLFYGYVVVSVNYYRKEILARAKEGYVIKGKVKAPYPIRVSVLLVLVALASNLLLFVVVGNEKTILINSVSALFFVNLLWRYQRRIKKIDKENI